MHQMHQVHVWVSSYGSNHEDASETASSMSCLWFWSIFLKSSSGTKDIKCSTCLQPVVTKSQRITSFISGWRMFILHSSTQTLILSPEFLWTGSPAPLGDPGPVRSRTCFISEVHCRVDAVLLLDFTLSPTPASSWRRRFRMSRRRWWISWPPPPPSSVSSTPASVSEHSCTARCSSTCKHEN